VKACCEVVKGGIETLEALEVFSTCDESWGSEF
jgi:hypothetical protein